LGAALVLAGCAPNTPPAVTDANAAISACVQSGGEMRQVGRAQTWQCILQYSDAGKLCTDASQCQGDCLAAKRDDAAPTQGVCAADSSRFGCRTTLSNGVANPTLCID